MDERAVAIIAKICHQANKAYCESLGDLSQDNWEAAHQWLRISAMIGVRAIMLNPTSTPEDSHKSWLREKAETGWKYGPVKDVDAKEHPYFASYEELPEEQKMKDKLFRAIVLVCIGKE